MLAIDAIFLDLGIVLINEFLDEVHLRQFGQLQADGVTTYVKFSLQSSKEYPGIWIEEKPHEELKADFSSEELFENQGI